jgi:hypothetical protein
MDDAFAGGAGDARLGRGDTTGHRQPYAEHQGTCIFHTALLCPNTQL